jgi:apolipoprotein N-acyltransferase
MTTSKARAGQKAVISLDLIKALLGLLFSVFSAVLLTAAFPPYNQGLLIWFGFLPMLVAQHRLLPRRFSSLAPAIAIGGWLGAFLIPIFGGKSAFMAVLPLTVGALLLLLEKGKRLFHERTGYRWFILEGTIGWVGMEMLRSLVPAIGTWGFIGYPLWSFPWFLQPLSIFGIYGLDLLVLLCNYTLTQAFLYLYDRRWPEGDSAGINLGQVNRSLGLLALLVAAWTGLSVVLYKMQTTATPIVRVAAIQPNLPRAAHRDTSTSPEQRLSVLVEQTRQAAAQGARIVVWPEMVLSFDPQVEYTQELRTLAAETQAYIIFGYVLEAGQGFRNEASVLAPSGQFLGIYGKTHPMITSGEPKTISAGTAPIFETNLGNLGVLICFDANFTDVARRLGRQGAQLIANPSLFGSPIAQLPYTQSIFRAIENRTAFVLADVGFNSAIVDPYGRLLQLAITPAGARTTLIADVPLGTGRSLYASWGDWLGWGSLLGLIFFAIFMQKKEK